MPRYERKPKRYSLTFEAHPGFEVMMRGLSIDGFMEIARMASKLTGSDLAKLEGARLTETLGAVDALFAKFAGALVSWNLDEDGKPVPATVEGVRSQELDFILEITLAWMDAIASVDNPLPRPANAPASSLASSMPMESLSPIPTS